MVGKGLKLMAIGLICQAVVGCNFVNTDAPGVIDADKMYADEQGFRDVLTGIYATLASNSLYGKELSYGFVDEIAQLYYNDYEVVPTTLTKTYNLDYEDEGVRRRYEAIWERAYYAIYALNDVLKHTEGRTERALKEVRAEALSLRALVHFDLLRLFASGRDQPQELAIPYVVKTDHNPTPRSTVAECYDFIIKDLNEAEQLSTPSGETISDVCYIHKEAIKALQARVYLWGGQKKEAKEKAKEVIAANYSLVKDERVLNLFNGYGAMTECIFMLNAPRIYIDVKENFFPNRLTPTCNVVRDRYKEIFQTSQFTPTNNDYRFQAYFSPTNWGKTVTAFTKLYDKNYDETQQWQEGRIPGINMLRLPEMYYIIAETAYNNDRQEALEALNKVIVARGLEPLTMDDLGTEENFKRVLFNEITKEYWGEGQIFFAAKRLGMELQGQDGRIFQNTKQTFVLPLPRSEE